MGAGAMTVRNFDPLAKVYDETRGGEEHGAASAAVLRRFLPSGDLLEIGVGTGLVAAELERAVIGVDISHEMLSRAITRIGPRVVRADAACLPFPSDRFAGGYAVWVFHLIEEHAGVWAELARVMRSGAVFVVETTATWLTEGDPVQAIVQRLYDAVLRGAPRRDRVASLRAAADAAGFDTVEVVETQLAFSESPLDTVDQISRRAGSAFHNLSEDDWTRVVEPFLAELRRLPDPDVSRTRSRLEHRLVLRRR